jgi:hypothetical protein
VVGGAVVGPLQDLGAGGLARPRHAEQQAAVVVLDLVLTAARRHELPEVVGCAVVAPDERVGAGRDAIVAYYRNLHDVKDVTVWGLHPYGDVEYAQKLWWERRHGKGGPGVPAPSGTRVYSFATALKQFNSRNSTKIHIWLDEISSFNGTGQGNHHYRYFTRASQAYGAQWLFDTLVRDMPRTARS